jgi:hypothetical protein
MSFEKPTRNKLASMVGDCRRLLTDDVRHQLQAVYGLQPDGTALPVSSLSHLDERAREVASALRLWHEHLASTEAGTETQRRKSAFDRLARETAFTVLNRLAALRMCEERGHVVECVRRGLESDGFALYERFSEGVLGGRGQTYRIFLERMFAELSVDLGVLFDLDAPQSLVFPRERCLEEVLSLLNRADLAHLWANDETIGWIYQYFNSKEEREAMREASAAPRNSRELAVRNQFFTPRYVVEFLVDNTLGRLWYEMKQSETTLKETCHYLVRPPSEIFLSQGQQTPSSAGAQEDLSQDELVKQLVYIPYRAKRDPRTLNVIDPAAGSGHFLLYAFDLLEVIYQEAWEDTNQPIFEITRKTLRDDYEDLDAFKVALPQLILRHNLHGIDIDLRACQIAALALWLRAQHAYQRLGLKTFRRPKIERSNIVCAEPMPGEQGLLDHFLNDLQPKVVGQLVQVVFEKMKLAGEAGSLLKIDEEIADAVAEAKKKWLAGPSPEQGLLFADLARTQQRELNLDFSGVTDEAFWERAEELIYTSLQNYAEQADNSHGYQRRLFANDAARGFAFIDLCRKHYDVMLMNPPFGDPSTRSSAYLDEAYGDSKGDIYQAFVERAAHKLRQSGFLGVISSRTGFFLDWSKDWRSRVVLRFFRPHLIADFGSGVLDAKIETAAYTLRSITEGEHHNLLSSIMESLSKLKLVEGSTFSLAEYAAAYDLNGYQAQQDLGYLVKEGFLRYVPGAPRRLQVVSLKSIAPTALPELPLPAVCFRLLSSPDKQFALLQCLDNSSDQRIFGLHTDSLADIPGAPFAYWISDQVRNAYRELPRFESQERFVRQGLATADDFRFLRFHWEVPPSEIVPAGCHAHDWNGAYCVTSYRWCPFTKGGEYAPFYTEQDFLINWFKDGSELRSFPRGAIRNADLYFRPGLTYLARTSVRLCASPLPRGSIFGHVGPGIFTPIQYLDLGLARFNSYSAELLLSPYHARGVGSDAQTKKYEVGLLQKLPWPCPDSSEPPRSARSAYLQVRKLRAVNETSRFFCTPPHPQSDLLVSAIDAIWHSELAVAAEYDFDAIQAALSTSDHLRGAEGLRSEIERTLAIAVDLPGKEPDKASGISYLLGCAFGRWDIRFATGEKAAPDLPDPFAPLPACSPGQFQNEQGLPITEEEVAKHRKANLWTYPIEIPWDGILVDDSDNENDIVRRIRKGLTTLWKERAEAIEQEVCETLGLNDLREYFRKPTLFFAEHLKRYSKSRRQAPIYLPLSTTSNSYTLWIYYHRLNADLLYTALNKYVKPKIDATEKQIRRIESELPNATGHDASSLRTAFERARTFLDELREFRDEISRIADLPYKPNLNDGVLITASPLWRLFRLPKWRKDLQECWKKLEAGDYDWSHLAYSIWPDRVRDACKSDRSIALAHGLESLCEVAAKPAKKKKSKQIAIEEAVPGDEE